MASGAVVLCEDSAVYDHVLPRDIRVSYRPDLSDFREKLSGILFDQMRRHRLAKKPRGCSKSAHVVVLSQKMLLEKLTNRCREKSPFTIQFHVGNSCFA